jgi:Fe-S oxidoreductase
VFTQSRTFAPVLKKLGGIAARRSLPPFAKETFTAAFARKRVGNGAAREIILWPDTFTNHFEPEIAHAAARVLRRAGFHVRIPERWLCCGRPLYDWGRLDAAKRLWRRTLATLAPDIEAGTLIVGLEPSCVSAFRDELINLFPQDLQAQRLSRQVVLMSELLADLRHEADLPTLARRAVVHQHCHHKSIMGNTRERQLLTHLGLDYEVPASSCCGMAGAFGFEPSKFDVSIKCGEQGLLPAVRAASADTLIVADGFSCREQIRQCTDRRPIHLVQAIDEAWGRAQAISSPPTRNQR